MATATLEDRGTWEFRAVVPAAGRVDRESRVIYGVVVAALGEAKGHELIIDETTLDQLVELGNGQRGGVKSRFGHPKFGADAIGSHVGRLRNFRRDGTRAIADLFLDPSAESSPRGNLPAFIMNQTQSDPSAFGMSIVFSGRRQKTDGKPVLRITELHACDLTDDPAATSGMFSAAAPSSLPEPTNWLASKLGAQQEQEQGAELAASFSAKPTLTDDDFKAEYAADQKRLHARGTTLEDFILSRRVDCGIQTLSEQIQLKRDFGSAL